MGGMFATSLDMFLHVLATHDKLQVAAFAQLAVDRGSNTCVYVIAIFTMCESTEQRICMKFCFKIRKTATETYQLLQQAYGEDAMGHTQVFD